jgi:hypothetical protein
MGSTYGLEFRARCLCAGTGCGGHITQPWPVMTRVTPAGYQGPAQHTYTHACAGFHPAGPCPGRSSR